ncbi:MAG TPA: hypothetical protein VKF15_01385 [Nitrososphaerales archaeon]|nr:hypothetical protein [Nitrososphaerales archaeon]
MRPDTDSDEDLPGLTRKSPFAPTAKLCPRCLKPLQRGSKLGGWLVPQDYVCPNCGYRGTVYLEKDLELNQAKKDEN